MRRGQGVGSRVAPSSQVGTDGGQFGWGYRDGEGLRVDVHSQQLLSCGWGAIVQELGFVDDPAQVPQVGEEATEGTRHLVFGRDEYDVVDVVRAEGAVSFRRDVFEGTWEGPHGGACTAHPED